MAFDLTNIFTKADLKEVKQLSSSIVSLAYQFNKKTGARVARAVFDNGTSIAKTVTASGAVIDELITIPKITSTSERNNVIRDLAKQKMTQDEIATLLDISQSTVSNVLKNK